MMFCLHLMLSDVCVVLSRDCHKCEFTMDGLTIGLLEKTQSARCDDALLTSNDPSDIYVYLQHEFDSKFANGEFDEHMDLDDNETTLVDAFIESLKSNIEEHDLRVESEGKVEDIVDLNVVIEESLLEYELKLNLKQDNQVNFLSITDVREKMRKLENVDDVKLLKHYVELLKIGYTPNFKNHVLQNDQNSIGTDPNLIEQIISLIFSIAIENKIELPSYNETSINGRVTWFKECIYKIISDSTNGKARDDLATRGKSKSDLKLYSNQGEEDSTTALKDLQFAHNYLTKKYEEDNLEHSRYINNMAIKYKKCEKLLIQSNKELDKLSQKLIDAKLQEAELKKQLEERTNEVHQLLMMNNLLKVDALGNIPVNKLLSPGSPSNDWPPSASASTTTTTTSTSLSPLASTDDISVSLSPNSQQSPSVRILRAEFRKLAEQMNIKFQQEINKIKQQ